MAEGPFFAAGIVGIGFAIFAREVKISICLQITSFRRYYIQSDGTPASISNCALVREQRIQLPIQQPIE